MGWHVLNNEWSVSSEKQVSWDIYEAVSATQTYAWTIFEAVSNTLSYAWQIWGYVNNALSYSWNLLNSVYRAGSISWDINTYFGTNKFQYIFKKAKRTKNFHEVRQSNNTKKYRA